MKKKGLRLMLHVKNHATVALCAVLGYGFFIDMKLFFELPPSCFFITNRFNDR